MRQENDTIFHEYEGEGKILFKNSSISSIPCHFTLIQKSDGVSHLESTVQLAHLDSVRHIWEHTTQSYKEAIISFEGKTQAGLTVIVSQLMSAGQTSQSDIKCKFICSVVVLSSQVEEAPHSIRFSVVNLITHGILQSNYVFDNGLEVPCYHSLFKLRNKAFMLVPKSDQVRFQQHLEAHQGITVTCEVVTTITSFDDIAEVENTMDIFSSLSTFVHGSVVNWISYDVISSTGKLLKRYLVAKPTSDYIAHISNKHWSASVWIKDEQKFIEMAFSRYEEVWDDWDIFAAINFFTAIRGQKNFPEATGLQLASCVEIINAQYLNRTEKRKVFKKFDKKLKSLLKKSIVNFFVEHIFPKEFCDLSERDAQIVLQQQCETLVGNLPNVNGYPFVSALTTVCKELNFDVGNDAIKRFKNNRNKLVHAGLFAVSEDGINTKTMTARQKWDWYGTKSDEVWKELRFMEDFVGKLVLSALDCPQKLSGW